MDEGRDKQLEIATAQAVMNVQKMYKSGKLQAMRGTEHALSEILKAPATPFGSVDMR